MTIWVNKSGIDLDVGETEKGAEDNFFNYNASGIQTGLPCVDSSWMRENDWNAWLYALGTTLGQGDDFFVRVNFTIGASFGETPSTARPRWIWGLFDSSQTTNERDSVNGFVFWDGSGSNHYASVYEDDGTSHLSGSIAPGGLSAGTAFYVTVVHNAATNTLTYTMKKVSDDSTIATRTLTTTGWTWSVTHVGISGHKNTSSTGRMTDPFEVTLIKANSGITEEFPSIPGNASVISSVMNLIRKKF